MVEPLKGDVRTVRTLVERLGNLGVGVGVGTAAVVHLRRMRRHFFVLRFEKTVEERRADPRHGRQRRRRRLHQLNDNKSSAIPLTGMLNCVRK